MELFQLFETEVNRKIRKEPALAMEIGQMGDLFPVSAGECSRIEIEEAVGEKDVVNDLWDFAWTIGRTKQACFSYQWMTIRRNLEAKCKFQILSEWFRTLNN